MHVCMYVCMYVLITYLKQLRLQHDIDLVSLIRCDFLYSGTSQL